MSCLFPLTQADHSLWNFPYPTPNTQAVAAPVYHPRLSYLSLGSGGVGLAARWSEDCVVPDGGAAEVGRGTNPDEGRVLKLSAGEVDPGWHGGCQRLEALVPTGLQYLRQRAVDGILRLPPARSPGDGIFVSQGELGEMLLQHLNIKAHWD